MHLTYGSSPMMWCANQNDQPIVGVLVLLLPRFIPFGK